MIRNYLKTALRYFARYRQYTFINIAGLAMAIACCILIMLYVRNEFGYDRFHSKAGRIVRLWQHEMYNGEEFICTVSPYSAGPVIASEFPEVRAFSRVYALEPVIKIGDRSFTEPVRMVDSTFFTLFDFKLLKGDSKNPFPGPSSILLTPETARKIFGSEEPLGRSILMNIGAEQKPFTVSGIVESPPSNSSIRCNCLIPYSNAHHLISKSSLTSWTVVNGETYLLLKDEAAIATLEKKLPPLVKRYLGENYKEGAFTFHLQPIADIHLNNELPEGIEPISDPKYSFILSSIGILLLLVASINFIILSIGRSVSRFREVGVRKVLGAEKRQLVQQFWGESLLITIFAALVGVVLSAVLFKPFKDLIGVELNFYADLISLGICFVIILLIALMAGIYPAVILAGYNPVNALKNVVTGGKKGNWFQNALVVAQLVISIALIVCTLTIRKQLNYVNTIDLGYHKNRLVVIETHKRAPEGYKLAERMKNELAMKYSATEFCSSFYSFAQSSWVELGFTQPDKVYKGFQYNSIDPSFVKAMRLKIVSGREFDLSNPSDLNNGAIVNETFLREFAIHDPVGKMLPGPFGYRIIGVVKDFNFQSLHTPVRPLVLTVKYDSILQKTENISLEQPPHPRITVRLKEGSLDAAVAELEQMWKKAAPGELFDVRFLDESLENMYKNERRTAALTGIMAILSILIACMGLFGLATLNIARRTKEIGIRKVLGASVTVIMKLFSANILIMVFVATLITVPVTYLFLDKWLLNFSYRISIGWEIFLISFVITLVIALATISFQTLRAALANPVKSLRTE